MSTRTSDSKASAASQSEPTHDPANGRVPLYRATDPNPVVEVRAQLSATERLVDVAQELSMARDLKAIMSIVRRAARELTGADGATFILADGDLCFYADENAISPLWKGRRFPMSSCISGWAMLNKKHTVIDDIYRDARIPHDAYRPTFVKSLAMVPIRTKAPVGAIGNYWAERHLATDGEVKLLQALADLTSVAMENVQLYGELRKRILEAQQALQARDEFIAIAAHELRTPLTALHLQVQNLAELAEKSGGSDGRFSERASRAAASTRRLAALIDGLLDVSRVTHGVIHLNLEEFDLGETTHEVVERFRRLARRAGCDLTVDVYDPVPGRWDRARIEQVLASLLSNALKFGSGRPIGVRLEKRAGVAQLKVCDHGVGIEPDVAAKIFERFGRVGAVTHYAGLGLGLFLARQVVEAHGGTIRFESEPNAGCIFIVELPLDQVGKE